MTDSISIVRITVSEMRERFNEGKYLERLRSGEFSALVRETRHPALTEAQEPYCTMSQMISYLDKDANEIARVHQYLRPDGNIGASGKPDPKRLMEGKTLYRLIKGQNK